MKPNHVERRLFKASGRIFAEYLIKRIGDEGKEVLYKLDRAGENVETRPATHAEKARLHKFVNEERSLPTYPLTRMRDLHTSLAIAISRQDDRCPCQFDRSEWKQKLARAKAQVEKRGRRLDLDEIASAIIPRRSGKNWRELVCRTCRTPLLTGYVLDGRKITRGKEFCCDSCRVAEHRRGQRKKRPASGQLEQSQSWEIMLKLSREV